MNKLSSILVLSAAVALAACGRQESAPAPSPAPAPAAAPAPAPSPAPAPAAAPAPTTTAAADAGKTLYTNSCAACHAAGVTGAPKPGDKADWAPRIAQGMEVLNKHAIEGYTGSKGQMPPRGGSTASDDDIKAAVKFMVDQSR